MMRIFVIIGLLLFLWCVVQATTDSKPTYAILLERTYMVGEKYHIAVTGSEELTREVTSNGETLENQNSLFTMRLEGTVQVLKVDAQKRPVKESITIARCVKVVGNDETPLAAKGSVVVAAVVDDSHLFTIDGKPVSWDLERGLNIAIYLAHGEPTDDEILGTKARQHVGDSWNVNTTKMAKSMKDIGGTVAAKDITGNTTLQEVVPVDGQPCLRVTSQLTMDKVKLLPDLEDMSPIYTMSLKLSGLFPVDAGKVRGEDQHEMTMVMVLKREPSKDDPVSSVKETTKQTVMTKYSPAE